MSFFDIGKQKLNLNSKTYVMGILNVTPDSFSDGGKWQFPEEALKRAIEIENQGADILDIGAQSTRPGSVIISSQEELSRLQPALEIIKNNISIPISVDTFYPEVAREALKSGADIINDITGFENLEMFKLAAEVPCGIIIMHNKENHNILKFFYEQLNTAAQFNIKKERICFDPGIGFNKSHLQNLYIIKNLKSLKVSENAMLVGVSRKRMIGNCCGCPPPTERLAGTIAANTIAVMNGANIIRVHDVKEGVQAARVTDQIIAETSGRSDIIG